MNSEDDEEEEAENDEDNGFIVDDDYLSESELNNCQLSQEQMDQGFD
jgi:hypothetical protein